MLLLQPSNFFDLIEKNYKLQAIIYRGIKTVLYIFGWPLLHTSNFLHCIVKKQFQIARNFRYLL